MKIKLNDEIVEFKDSKGNILTDEQIIRSYEMKIQKLKDTIRELQKQTLDIQYPINKINLILNSIRNDDDVNNVTVFDN
tara:strand:- start:633 stop:869 length:237 start_codon:yes stop_codon:yes gene_type:complete